MSYKKLNTQYIYAKLLNMCHATEQYCRNIPFNYYILLNFYCVAASLFILGTVYVHPYITYPLLSHQRSFLPHIRIFEKSSGFAKIYEAIITQGGGRRKIIKENDEGKTKEYEYLWKKVRT